MCITAYTHAVMAKIISYTRTQLATRTQARARVHQHTHAHENTRASKYMRTQAGDTHKYGPQTHTHIWTSEGRILGMDTSAASCRIFPFFFSQFHTYMQCALVYIQGGEDAKDALSV